MYQYIYDIIVWKEVGIMKKHSKIPGYGLGVRHWQVALIFSMVVIMYIINMAAPMAIVAITDPGTSPNPKVPVSSAEYLKWLSKIIFWIIDFKLQN